MTALRTTDGAVYRIEDEPIPGRLERLVVDPMWPLFALMLGGAWIGLPWFVLNAVALGTATLRREIIWTVAGFLGAAAMAFGILYLEASHLVGAADARYLWLLAVTWKL